jgi:hypothetical protein
MACISVLVYDAFLVHPHATDLCIHINNSRSLGEEAGSVQQVGWIMLSVCPGLGSWADVLAITCGQLILYACVAVDGFQACKGLLC